MKIRADGVLRDMTAEELAEYRAQMQMTAEERIEQLKRSLADTDYQSIRDSARTLNKIMSALSRIGINDVADEECLQRETLRETWRDEINRLESEGDTDV